jgi:hypothetical protein
MESNIFDMQKPNRTSLTIIISMVPAGTNF